MRVVYQNFVGKASYVRTPLLLGAAAVLQILDWHSTLIAHKGRGEANLMLNWLEQWARFAVVLSCVKLIFLAVLLVGYLYWRRHKGLYELEYGACLSILVFVYGAVVFNNYLA